MKFSIFSFILIIFTFKSVHSENIYLRNFMDIINQEQSISNSVYILERCAGLFASVGSRFVNSGRSDSTDLGNKMIMMGVDFTFAAVKVASSENLNVTIENSTKESIEIGKIYSKIMDDNHRRTGNALTGQVVQDQEVCMVLYKSIQGN